MASEDTVNRNNYKLDKNESLLKQFCCQSGGSDKQYGEWIFILLCNNKQILPDGK